MVCDAQHFSPTRPNTRIPVSLALYGHMGFNTHVYNDAGQVETLQHLTLIVRDTVEFVKRQAAR